MSQPTLRRSLVGVMAIACLVSIPIAPPRVAHATSMRIASLAELARLADAVAWVSAADASALWHEGRIYTRTTVDLIRSIGAGSRLPQSFEIWTLGGVVDGIGQRVPGEGQLVPGEECLVFLRRSDDGTYRTVGMWQGVFHRFASTLGNTRLVRWPDGHGDGALAAGWVDPIDEAQLESDLLALPPAGVRR